MNSYFKRYLIIAVLAILAIFVYSRIPPSRKSIAIWPANDLSHLKSFANTGDVSSALTFGAIKDQLNIAILLNASDPTQAWASLQFDLKKIHGGVMNWLFMDSLIIELSTYDTPELMLKVLTWDPDVSQSEDPSTYRILIKELPLSKGLQHIAIPAEHLYVPDWWYTQRGVSKDLDSKHLEGVTHFEISTTEKTPLAKQVRIDIQQIRVEGPKRTNFVILLAFLFVLALAAIGLKPTQGPIQ